MVLRHPDIGRTAAKVGVNLDKDILCASRATVSGSFYNDYKNVDRKLIKNMFAFVSFCTSLTGDQLLWHSL